MDQTANRQAAFTAALEARLRDIYSYFRRLGVEAASAEDLAQETFVLAWQNLSSLRDESKLKSWLYCIAYRRFLRYRAGAAKQPVALAEDHAAGSKHDPGSDEYLAAHIVRQVLPTLPEKYLHPLLLVYWEDLSYQEAARVLSLPAGTLAWRVHRALKLIRQALAEKGDGHEIELSRPKAVGATDSLDKS